MAFLYRLVIIIIIGIAFSGCATNRGRYEGPSYDVGVLPPEPENGWDIEEVAFDQLDKISPGKRPAIDTDEAGLWMMADKIEEQIKTSGNRVSNEELEEYLNDVVCRLVPDYCEDIRVYLLEVPFFDASTYPNGMMVISSGLLLRVENEAQLAGVISHEMGHYLRRHALQRRNKITKTGGAYVAGLAVSAGTAVVTGPFSFLFLRLVAMPGAAILGKTLALGDIMKYSRDQEREADGYGIALMSRAGYDPREYAKLCELIIKEKEVDKHIDWNLTFFSTHPSTEERQKAIMELGERIIARGGSYELRKEQFNKVVLPRKMEYLVDELHLRNFEKTEGLIDTLMEGGYNLGELRFCKGELYRLRGEDGDNEKALQEYMIAAGMKSPPPETYRAMGIIFMKGNRKGDAINAFNNYLELSSNPPDEKMILRMIMELEQ